MVYLPHFWPCLPGSLFSCAGECLWADSCVLKSRGYTSCISWVGDGTCDDSFRHSDDGNTNMAFNCPMYGCDGGDCESCGSNPEGVPRTYRIPKALLSGYSDELEDGKLRILPGYSFEIFCGRCPSFNFTVCL